MSLITNIRVEYVNCKICSTIKDVNQKVCPVCQDTPLGKVIAAARKKKLTPYVTLKDTRSPRL